MSELSPAALTVWSAFLDHYEWEVTQTELCAVAAALRTAAEQIVLPKYQYADWEMADLIMQEIQAIADELEPQ